VAQQPSLFYTGLSFLKASNITIITRLHQRSTSYEKEHKVCFKLKVFEFAKSFNNCAATWEFDATEKIIQDWRKNEDDPLKSMSKNMCTDSRCATPWPDLEEHVADMVNGNP
jgi:hypothetical protein